MSFRAINRKYLEPGSQVLMILGMSIARSLMQRSAGAQLLYGGNQGARMAGIAVPPSAIKLACMTGSLLLAVVGFALSGYLISRAPSRITMTR